MPVKYVCPSNIVQTETHRMFLLVLTLQVIHAVFLRFLMVQFV